MKAKKHLPTEKWYIITGAIVLLASVVIAFFQPIVAIVMVLSAIVLYFIVDSIIKNREKRLIEEIKIRYHGVESATWGTIMNAPLPMVIFQPDTDDVIWTNERFLEITENPEHIYDTKLSEIVPDFQSRWLVEGKIQSPEPVQVQNRNYLVFGNQIDTQNEDGNLAISYWVDVSHYIQVEVAYEKSRPVVAIILIDNYDDLMRGLEESERSVLITELNKRISQWADPTEGILCRYDRDQYLFFFEEDQLLDIQKKKYSVLESVREVRSPNAITATLSIGIGKGAPTLRELLQYADISVEIALSRGGDQLVIKDNENLQFIGGRTREAERLTKVKSRVVANTFSELLRNASKVFIMGHDYPDLDVIGASAGVAAISRKGNIPAFIIRDPDPNPAEEMTEALAKLPEYERVFIDPKEAMDRIDENSLVVVVDTNRPEQTLAPDILAMTKRVVVIDHHRRSTTYIENLVLSFEDPYASSASELMVELMQYTLGPGDLLRKEAEAILAGIVLDTKNFTLRTGGRTFEAAAYLRRAGADIGEIKKLFQSDLEGATARYEIIQAAKLYRTHIAIAMLKKTVDRVVAAQAADELLNIENIQASFVLFPSEDGKVILSARSVDKINVQLILEKLGGGGNFAVAGAQIAGKNMEEVAQDLKVAIDEYLDEE